MCVFPRKGESLGVSGCPETQSTGNSIVLGTLTHYQWKNPKRHDPKYRHFVMMLFLLSHATYFRCPGSRLPEERLSGPHLVSWPPVQAVGIELVDMQHVDGTFDAEMM